MSVLATGCVSTSQKLPIASMDTLDPVMALILLHRPEAWGTAVRVRDDGKVVGDIAPGGSLVRQRSAGKTNLKLSWVRPLLDAVLDARRTYCEVAAGQEYSLKILHAHDDFEVRDVSPGVTWRKGSSACSHQTMWLTGDRPPEGWKGD